MKITNRSDPSYVDFNNIHFSSFFSFYFLFLLLICLNDQSFAPFISGSRIYRVATHTHTNTNTSCNNNQYLLQTYIHTIIFIDPTSQKTDSFLYFLPVLSIKLKILYSLLVVGTYIHTYIYTYYRLNIEFYIKLEISLQFSLRFLLKKKLKWCECNGKPTPTTIAFL